MSDFSGRSREELLDELVAIITAGLATRSNDELETMIGLLDGSHFSGMESLPSPSQSVMVQVDPAAPKSAISEALSTLSSWVDENWEAARLQIRGIELPHFPDDDGMLN